VPGVTRPPWLLVVFIGVIAACIRSDQIARRFWLAPESA
jgi:hypothetical protein